MLQILAHVDADRLRHAQREQYRDQPDQQTQVDDAEGLHRRFPDERHLRPPGRPQRPGHRARAISGALPFRLLIFRLGDLPCRVFKRGIALQHPERYRHQHD
jgi:hypothetical protein